jgi:hypothetical protein
VDGHADIEARTDSPIGSANFGAVVRAQPRSTDRALGSVAPDGILVAPSMPSCPSVESAETPAQFSGSAISSCGATVPKGIIAAILEEASRNVNRRA